MKKWEDYRFFVCLLVGGIAFAIFMGYPAQLYNRFIDQQNTQTKADMDLLPVDDLSGNDMSDGSVLEASDGANGDATTTSNQDDGSGEDGQTPADDDASLTTYDFTTVDDSYFDDACFIGDSRIVCLYDYSGWNADFYCSSGMTLTQVFDEPNHKFKDGNWTENIGAALQEHSYKKVYIMIGINDMGVGDLDYFYNHYSDMIANIRQWQPDADIFIMAIMRVSNTRNAKGDYINNDAINIRNEMIAQLADANSIFYFDANEVMCDETGALNEEYTFDGVHLLAKYVPIWTDYIKAHGIVR